MPGVVKKVSLFAALVILLSAPWTIYMVRAGHLTLGAVTGLQWMPAVAALLLCVRLKLPLRQLGLRWAGFRWASVGYLLPLAYCLVVYGAVWASGLGAVPSADFISQMRTQFGGGVSPWLGFTSFFAQMATLGVLVLGVVGALGEEIGWRGFAAPLLVARFGYAPASFLLGLFWAVWHWPGILWADYHTDTPMAYQLACFTASVTAFNFILVWLRMRSGSIWPGVLAHAAHNIWIQEIFTPATRNTGPTNWWIDEFGAGLAIALALLAVFCWADQRNVKRIEARA